ncbi:hypothetical protein GXM_08038 [Nostoc sphaeroides CCNUC1]|uniref:Uncharacterized protein n=1 Tax=Nostoc sphaeroides CCNUC1 TaxID=2653204 RepID=A0A5P8WD33_9NOSO|nr:hypothetical protein GXM_08038 [Nostoc sphaeroides CCNUC1]
MLLLATRVHYEPFIIYAALFMFNQDLRKIMKKRTTEGAEDTEK